MKKMLLASRYGPALVQDVLNQAFTVQNKPAAVAPKETITVFPRFWNWAEENCQYGQFVAARKMLLLETQQKHS